MALRQKGISLVAWHLQVANALDMMGTKELGDRWWTYIGRAHDNATSIAVPTDAMCIMLPNISLAS